MPRVFLELYSGDLDRFEMHALTGTPLTLEKNDPSSDHICTINAWRCSDTDIFGPILRTQEPRNRIKKRGGMETNSPTHQEDYQVNGTPGHSWILLSSTTVQSALDPEQPSTLCSLHFPGAPFI